MRRNYLCCVGYSIGMLVTLIAAKYIGNTVWCGFFEGLGIAISWTFINLNQENNDK